VAGGGAGAAAVLVGTGQLRERAASRRRHRRRAREPGAGPGSGHRLVRRLDPARRAGGHDPDLRRLCGDAAAAGLDERPARRRRRGRRGCRRRRRERRCGHVCAARPPRRPRRHRSRRLRRPAGLASCPTRRCGTDTGYSTGFGTGTNSHTVARGRSSRAGGASLRRGAPARCPATGGRRGGGNRPVRTPGAAIGIMVGYDTRPAGRPSLCAPSRGRKDVRAAKTCAHRGHASDKRRRSNRGSDVAAGRNHVGAGDAGDPVLVARSDTRPRTDDRARGWESDSFRAQAFSGGWSGVAAGRARDLRPVHRCSRSSSHRPIRRRRIRGQRGRPDDDGGCSAGSARGVASPPPEGRRPRSRRRRSYDESP
jgi:hypothetical protein